MKLLSRAPRIDRVWLIVAPVLLVLVLLIVPPLWSTVRGSFGSTTPLGDVTGFTLENYGEVLDSTATTRDLLVNSIVFSVGSSLIGFILGTTLAFLVGRTDMPFKGFVEVMTLVKMAVPGLVYAIAWLLLLSPRGALGPVVSAFGMEVSSLPGMTFIEGFTQVPISYLLMRAIFANQDPSMEEASQVAGVRAWRTTLFISLPLALPGMVSVMLLNLIRTLDAFEIPAIIGLPGGVRTFVSHIYSLSVTWPPSYGVVGVYSVILIALLCGGLLINARVTRNAHKFETVKGKGGRRQPLKLGRYRLPAAALASAIILVISVAPLLMLLWVALSPYYTTPSWNAVGRMTLENFGSVLTLPSIQVSMRNSLWLAFASATLVVLIAAVVAWIISRTKLRVRGTLDLLANASLVIPGVVMGVALLTFYVDLPVPIYGTSLILILAYVSAFLPYGMRYAQPALIQLENSMEEAAMISGVSWLRRFIFIIMPLIKGALLAAWLYVFMLAFRELSRSILLYTDETAVVSVTMFGLWNDGQLTEVAAFAVILVAVLIPVAILIRRASTQVRM